MGKIGSGNLWRGSSRLPNQREGHISGPAAEIKNASGGPGKDMAECTRGTTPPQTVHVQRQHMIQQVVARRDGGEHFAHGPRRSLRVACAFWGSPDYRRFDFGHDAELTA
jgi:hypothetical protein